MRKILIFMMAFLPLVSTAKKEVQPQPSLIPINPASNLQEIKRLYELQVQALKELKVQSETLRSISDIYKELQVQKKAIKEFGNWDSWKKQFEKDYKDIKKELNPFTDENLTDAQRAQQIIDFIDLRIADPRERKNREWLIYQKAILTSKKAISLAEEKSDEPLDFELQEAGNQLQKEAKELAEKQAVIDNLKGEVKRVFKRLRRW